MTDPYSQVHPTHRFEPNNRKCCDSATRNENVKMNETEQIFLFFFFRNISTRIEISAHSLGTTAKRVRRVESSARRWNVYWDVVVVVLSISFNSMHRTLIGRVNDSSPSSRLSRTQSLRSKDSDWRVERFLRYLCLIVIRNALSMAMWALRN